MDKSYGAPPPYPTGPGGGPSQPPYPQQASYGYPAQAGYPTGYPVQAQAPTQNYVGTTVVVTGPMVTHALAFRECPVRTRCPSCQAEITTSTHYEVGTITWIVAGILLLFGLWLGCCLIPFCIDSCKDVVHTCPNCRSLVGRYNRM